MATASSRQLTLLGDRNTALDKTDRLAVVLPAQFVSTTNTSISRVPNSPAVLSESCYSHYESRPSVFT